MKVLLTGGSRGIGAAIVTALREAGHVVTVVSRTSPESDHWISVDLSKSYERFHLIEQAVNLMGGLDVLINNAGAQHHAPAIEYERSQWHGQIELMLTAPFDLSQQAAKYMLKHGGGRIINIASVAGIQGTRGIVAYSVAKAGLIEMTKCLSNEWQPLITVNAIAPGFIETDMQTLDADHKAAMLGRLPAGRFGTVEEVARTTLWLATDAPYITGTTILVDGGWLAR